MLSRKIHSEACAPVVCALTGPADSCRRKTGGIKWPAARLPLAVVILCLLFSLPGRAQTTAMLSGTVADQQGGVIPGAQVTLTDEATKVSRSVQSNETGLYAFPSLVPGNYTVKASAKGFKLK